MSKNEIKIHDIFLNIYVHSFLNDLLIMHFRLVLFFIKIEIIQLRNRLLF